jgi:hypothetical protein
MVQTVLLILILFFLVAIFDATKRGFNQVIAALESIDARLAGAQRHDVS